MCQPSVEIITYNWVERQDHRFPDFDIWRKSRAFEELPRWQEERRVVGGRDELGEVEALKKNDDDRQLPVPLLMLEAYSLTREEVDRFAMICGTLAENKTVNMRAVGTWMEALMLEVICNRLHACLRYIRKPRYTQNNI
jgi:Mycotoxin biosynthesis protein UstYa